MDDSASNCYPFLSLRSTTFRHYPQFSWASPLKSGIFLPEKGTIHHTLLKWWFNVELEDIYRRDLSLLVALRVLIEECSVSKAANRLNLSQSAMSRVLGRYGKCFRSTIYPRGNILFQQKALEIDRSR